MTEETIKKASELYKKHSDLANNLAILENKILNLNIDVDMDFTNNKTLILNKKQEEEILVFVKLIMKRDYANVGLEIRNLNA